METWLFATLTDWPEVSRYEVDVPPDLHSFTIAPMLLQPVVENAIRHGLEPKVDGGNVRFSARRDGADVLIEIADTGVGFAPTTRGGVGLTNLRDRLRLTNAEHQRLAAAASALTGLHGIETPPPSRELRALLYAAKRRAARDALRLAQADSRASPDDPDFAEADRFLAETPEPELPIGGADVTALGVPAGPQVGEILRAFEALWIEAGFPEDREAVDRLLKGAIEGGA